jgi:hypothetical protein
MVNNDFPILDLDVVLFGFNSGNCPLEQGAEYRHGDRGKFEIGVLVLKDANNGHWVGQDVPKAAGFQSILSDQVLDLAIKGVPR